MNLSVCIITRNRTESLSRALSCVKAQHLQAFEVIVVDNSTDNETRQMIAGKWPNVIYIECAGRLASQPLMRNKALAIVRGDIVAFIDDDGYPAPEWLEQISLCYNNPNTGAAGGRVIQGPETNPFCNGRCIIGRWDILRGPIGNFNCSKGGIIEVEHLQGTNMTFRKEAILAAGGFDMYLSKGYAAFEDTDAVLAVRKIGYKAVFNPAAVVTHGVLQREGYAGRKIGEKCGIAYAYGRNHSYVVLKHFGINPLSLLEATVIGGVVDIKRCLSSGPRGVVTLWCNIFGRIQGTFSGLLRIIHKTATL